MHRETLYAIIITYFVEVRDMKASYKKLWKLLIDKEMRSEERRVGKEC